MLSSGVVVVVSFNWNEEGNLKKYIKIIE